MHIYKSSMVITGISELITEGSGCVLCLHRDNIERSLVYTIHLSLVTDLVDLPPMGTFYMKLR